MSSSLQKGELCGVAVVGEDCGDGAEGGRCSGSRELAPAPGSRETESDTPFTLTLGAPRGKAVKIELHGANE